MAYHILVIGAGIVGSALAFRLAQAGARVTLVDAGPPAGGVTAAAFGWIGPQCPAGRPDQMLKRAAMPAWRRLETILGRSLVAWTGALLWRESTAETEALLARESEQRGLVPLSREAVAERAPALLSPPRLAAFAPGEGATDPAAVAALLGAAAQRAGAAVVTGAGPVTLATRAAAVTGAVAGGSVINADAVVVAAGTGTRTLCRAVGLDLPVGVSPAVRVRLTASRPLAAMIHEGPLCEVRPVPGGLFAAEDWRDDQPLHDIAAVVAGAIKRTYRGADDIGVTGAVVGERPMPEDGAPLIGHARNTRGLYVAVMHSGVTLAPIVAELAAREILEGAAEPLLQGCRPDRG